MFFLCNTLLSSPEVMRGYLISVCRVPENPDGLRVTPVLHLFSPDLPFQFPAAYIQLYLAN